MTWAREEGSRRWSLTTAEQTNDRQDPAPQVTMALLPGQPQQVEAAQRQAENGEQKTRQNMLPSLNPERLP